MLSLRTCKKWEASFIWTREFRASYFFVPGACDRPISCWEPTNQTFMAAAWATCSLAQNYLWLVLPRKTWFSRSECPGSRHVFWSFNSIGFRFHFGMPRFFQPANSRQWDINANPVEIFQCDGHRRIACPHATGLASADRTARPPTDCWDAGPMMCWWQGWKTEIKTTRRHKIDIEIGWHWHPEILDPFFGSFFWNMQIPCVLHHSSRLIKVRVFWDLRSCCQPLCVRTLKGFPTALGQLDMWWSLAELMTCRCELRAYSIQGIDLHQCINENNSWQSNNYHDVLFFQRTPTNETRNKINEIGHNGTYCIMTWSITTILQCGLQLDNFRAECQCHQCHSLPLMLQKSH